jgi:large subunit ribosomal protein L17
MRHLKSGRKFSRTSAHRKALFRNLVTALLENERIRTTLPKAKELRSKVEKTITLGKKGTLHARRRALRLVAERDILAKLFGPIAERYADRPGGYTRIIKLGNRLGDDAPMAYIELVDREEKVAEPEKKVKPKKTEKVAEPEKKAKTKKTEAKEESSDK